MQNTDGKLKIVIAGEKTMARDLMIVAAINVQCSMEQWLMEFNVSVSNTMQEMGKRIFFTSAV